MALVFAVMGYLPSYLSGIEYRGGSPREWVRRGLLQRIAARRVGFKYALDSKTSTEELSSLRQAIFVIVPHGQASLGHFLFGAGDVHGFWSQVCPGLERRGLGAGALFKIPLVREYSLALGVVDAGKASARRSLAKGYSITVVPGGVMSQALTVYGEAGMYIRSRKGFCKLALEYGCDIVPVYVFGETLLYRDIPWMKPLAKWLAKKFWIGAPGVIGDKLVLPMRPEHGLVAVVGKPIQVKRLGSIGRPQVEALHKQFLTSLEALFESNKDQYGYGGKRLYDFSEEDKNRPQTDAKSKTMDK